MSFLPQLSQSWPSADWQDVTVLVAVSGGADSVALLCGLAELRSAEAAGKLVAAHFNHRLRAAADDDVRFVAELANQWKIPCEIGQADSPLADDCPDGIEAAARDARYDFLLKTAENVGARFVATAHTADDQAETILFRILRGTGLQGLSGIPRSWALSPAVTLIRPLQECTREDVVEYLAARHQVFCRDETNDDQTYTRNRIRHALLPQLAAQYNPNVRDALLRLGQQAGDAQRIVHRYTRELLERTAQVVSPDQVIVNVAPLQTEPRHLVREVFVSLWKKQHWRLQQMNSRNLDAVADLALTHSAAALPTRFLNLPGNVRAERIEDRVVLICKADD